ncbi:EAL domain-containing protein [Sedimenticola thiotaurini]|uniref:EAL domain-containing protein n=1 Tax=Sedimenticola thiotaurini TaxID=1543721 RepID=UPI00069B3D42|nr:EAL domain-containing protein [Sedimenticola thiotaurini]
MFQFRNLICRLRIRKLLLLMLGLLCSIAISAIAWNSIDVIRQHQTASQLGLANLLADRALKLNTELAAERGLTGIFLATSKQLSTSQLLLLENQRKQTDQSYHLFRQLLPTTLDPTSTIPINQSDPVLQQIWQRLLRLRTDADLALMERKQGLSATRWFELITNEIEQVAKLQRSIIVSNREGRHLLNHAQILRDAVSTMMEYTGRERATIGSIIASKKPIRMDQHPTLLKYREAIKFGENRCLEILAAYPQSDGIQSAITRYHEVFRGEFENLRNQVLDASSQGKPYPVDELTWYSEASRAIATMSALFEAASVQNLQDLEAIQRKADQTVMSMLATILLVILLFATTYIITYRRILTPLKLLEQAARTIESGDLGEPVKLHSKDEFGQLGQSFESMRLSLLADRKERELAEQELRKLHQAVEQSVSSLVITDAEGVTEYVNHRFELTTGYRQDEIIGRKFNKTRSGQIPPELYQEMWNTIRSGNIWEGELLNRKRNGELYWELVSISPVRDKQGKISHFIGIQHDISRRKAMEQQLNFLAYHDELTGLANRRLLTDRFDQMTDRLQSSTHQGALLILDLNRFKLINDSLGHDTGDRVLVEIANRLKELIHPDDTISRYGGAEFVILVSKMQSVDAVTDLARRISRTISQPVKVDKRLLHVSCSLGIALYPRDGRTLDKLLSNADAAMYQAKTRHGEKLQFFTEALSNQVQQRMEMENDLRNALRNGELEVYYQPQYDQVAKRIIGMEALLRWHHPRRGLVTPDRFIPLAEETGLILPIGEWVLETACRQLRQFHREGYPDLMVAVNVSVRQLEGQDMTEIIKRVLDKVAINPATLEIEITESTMMEDPERMIEALDALKRLHVRLALDDFGTGHSSLSYLQRFPFDKIKIDRAFIRNITRSEDDGAIATTIGAMAKSLKLDIIAEGVETEEQMTFLKNCGCDKIQGYLISKPIPAAEFRHLLARHQIEPDWIKQNTDPQKP